MRSAHYLRYMLRESRGSLGRLGFFVACLAVGVAAVVAVAGLSEGLETGVGREARRLLAADLVVEGRQPLTEEIDALLESEVGGDRATLKEMVTVVAAAQNPSRDGLPAPSQLPPSQLPTTSQLVELKAVEGSYPFYGRLELEPPQPLSELLDESSAVVAPDLLARLELALGDSLRIGRHEFRIAGVVHAEPDRMGMALAAGPRVFLSVAGLARAELEQFGSRISYRTLVKLPSELSLQQLDTLAEALREKPEIEARYRVETYADAQPAVRRALSRVERFLGLVALLSLLLGGVGVAQATRAWLEGRIDAMAVLRSIGFRPNEVLLLYFGQTVALGLAGSVLGVAVGLAVLALTPSLIGDLLPEGLGLNLWQPWAALRGMTMGLGTALLFSFAPLMAVRRVRPLRALRKDVEPLEASPWARWSTGLAVAGGVAVSAIIQASSVRDGLSFTAGIALAAGLLAAVSVVAIRLLRLLPQRRLQRTPVWLRHGVAALVRPGAGTVGAVVAVGLGVLLLLGMALVQSGLSGQLSTALPAQAPSAFLIDIQTSQWQTVQEILRQAEVESVNSAPVVTARIGRVDGTLVTDLVETSDSRGQRWALTREQRVTYLDELAPDNEIQRRLPPKAERGAAAASPLWNDPERWELSVEEEYAEDLGLEIGSEVELDVQGVPVAFTVTSIRSVDWSTFDLNFFFVAEPAALEAAPQFRVATVRLPRGSEQGVQDQLALAAPNVTMIQVRDVLEKVARILDRLAFGVQFLGGFTVLAGLVILAGSVSANSIRRSREIAVLKTLGMVRREVALMFTVEFALLGLLAGAMGATGGVLLSRAVLIRGMEIDWTFEPSKVLLAVGVTVILTAAAAVLAGSRALAVRPLEVLRGE